MLWDQLRPGQKFELETNLTQGCSTNPHQRLVCHLLKPVLDARRVMTTLPFHEGMASQLAHTAYPTGTRLQVRFMDPLLGCWYFQAGIADYDQHEGLDALVLSAWTTLSPCDRRAYARQPCSIPVRLMSTDFAFPVQATILNYSAGGVLIETEIALPLSRRVALILKTGLGYTLSVKSKVVRQEQIVAGLGYRYHIALQFDDPRPGLTLR